MIEAPSYAPWLVGALLDLQNDVVEIPGTGMHPRVRDWFQAVGAAWVTDDAVPHCAAFVGAHLRWTGQKIPKAPLRARSFLTIGNTMGLEPPWPIGSVAVLKRGPGDPGPEVLDFVGHTGFVLGFTGSAVFLLGANQRWKGMDRVSLLPFRANLLLDVRWPEPVEIHKEV